MEYLKIYLGNDNLVRRSPLQIAEKVDPFKGDLYRYLNFDQIDGFENFGRVIPKSEMPKLEALV